MNVNGEILLEIFNCVKNKEEVILEVLDCFLDSEVNLVMNDLFFKLFVFFSRIYKVFFLFFRYRFSDVLFILFRIFEWGERFLFLGSGVGVV